MRLNSYQSLKLGFEDSSGVFVSGYYGTIASSFMKEFPNIVQALNETVALDMAHIHSYLGKRSLVIMKNVGLNEAALPFRNICDVGVNAGLIIVVTDDISVDMSENKQDSRVYAELGKTLLLEPKSPSELYEMVYEGFKISEVIQMPILLRITNALNNNEFYEDVSRKKKTSVKFRRAKFDQSQWVLNPMNTEKVIKLHSKRYRQILSLVEKSKFNNIKGKHGKIGCIYSQALIPKEREILEKYDSIFSVGTFPLPKQKTKDFINKNKSLEIIDSGESILVNEMSRVISDLKINKLIERDYKWRGLRMTVNSKWFNYTSLFYLIKERNPSIIIGDFGSYTLASESPIEYALHYGGAIACGVGAFIAGEKNIYVVVGDGGFSSGIEGLIEASRKNARLNIIVIENFGISKKENINLDLEKIALGNGATFVKRVSVNELNNKIFDELESNGGISVLFLDYSKNYKLLK